MLLNVIFMSVDRRTVVWHHHPLSQWLYRHSSWIPGNHQWMLRHCMVKLIQDVLALVSRLLTLFVRPSRICPTVTVRCNLLVVQRSFSSESVESPSSSTSTPLWVKCRTVKRIPKNSRERAGRKLASILETVVTNNDLTVLNNKGLLQCIFCF